MHKDCLEKKFRAETPTGVKLSRFFARGRPTASGGPLGVTFGPEIKNLCGNHMLCTFHISCEKKFLLLNLQTLLTENWPIFDNFDSKLFLVEKMIGIYKKKRLEINFELDFGPFLSVPFHYLT